MKIIFTCFCTVLCSLLFLGISYADDLDIQMLCPESVQVDSPLDVTIQSISNEGYETITIQKALVGLGGNMGNSIAGLALFGPYSRNFNLTLSPWQQQTGPWTIRIIDRVPRPLAGKVAAITVVFTRSDYSELGGDGCGILVVK